MNSMNGPASAPGSGNEGPMPRTITVFGAVPVIMNPPIIALSPSDTQAGGDIGETSERGFKGTDAAPSPPGAFASAGLSFGRPNPR